MTNEIKEMNFSEMLFNRDERLLDYITNLQNEIFDLKDTIQNKNDCIGAYECIIEDRDKRIDKAIEYLIDEKREFSEDSYYKICETIEAKELLNILRGDD